jgi:hypothetical protein
MARTARTLDRVYPGGRQGRLGSERPRINDIFTPVVLLVYADHIEN